jgi:A/G-specific adenine glycosylase
MNFSNELINWYLANKRDLPWRDTNDAYVIWLSEIILQQTRVEQGMPYFNRFLEKYPDVASFAAASEDDILRLWQGLGYYSRGRNMLKTARTVVEKYNGLFPVLYNDLIALKGIGAYTASAIASFAANGPHAVVDGNVYRVLARYFGVSEPINTPAGIRLFQQLADELLDREHAGLHNQAMMEFGAMICKPKNPDCAHCPVSGGCVARLNGSIAQLPVKLNKVKIRERYFNYFLVFNDGKILLNKRGENDIWANMYELPLIETATLLTAEQLIKLDDFSHNFGIEAVIMRTFGVRKHLLTHQRLFVNFFEVKTDHINLENSFFADKEEIKNLALPKIVFIFINNLFNL